MLRIERFERKALPVFAQVRGELGKRHAGFNGDRLIGGRVIDDAREAARVHERVVGLRRNVTERRMRPAAHEANPQRPMRKLAHRGSGIR